LSRFPKAAAVLFAANSYSSRDAATPLCDQLDVARRRARSPSE
jgi:hypothetical protein